MAQFCEIFGDKAENTTSIISKEVDREKGRRKEKEGERRRERRK